MPPSSSQTASPMGLQHDTYAPWSRGIFPAGAYKGAINMISQSDHRLSISISGPESNPAGAVSGRAAATFHPHPVPLPGTDHRTPAAQSAPRPRMCVRRGRRSPTRFQRGAGDHTQPSKTTETDFRIAPRLPLKT